jgi:methylated-DNA-[protein]-cysteine S-methyltransferase
MALITSPKRNSSSLDAPYHYDSTDARKSYLADLQKQQIFLLSEDNDHVEPSCGNSSLNVKKVSSLTPFQRKVYTALCLVPEGCVTTYQSIGTYINCSSSQAIGQALKRNPYAPIVPCHRVVKSNGMIGGFHGHTSGNYIDKKIALLRSEGVDFLSTKSTTSTSTDVSVDPKCFHSFASNSSKSLDSVTRKKRKTSNF